MQPEKYGYETSRTNVKAGYDAGLRAHMGSVYNRMAAGILVTAITSYIIGTNEQLLMMFLGGPQKYVFMFAPLVILMFGFNPLTMSSQKLKVMFFVLSALYGVSFATIAAAATGNPEFAETVARALFMTVAMFAGISIFGYTTKKDLSALGTFSVMAIIGVLVLGLVNFFFIESSAFANIISIVALLAFAGITAWEVQSTKQMYHASNGEEANSRMAWSAALTLYISFIAIFSHLLSLLNNND